MLLLLLIRGGERPTAFAGDFFGAALEEVGVAQRGDALAEALVGALEEDEVDGHAGGGDADADFCGAVGFVSGTRGRGRRVRMGRTIVCN